MTHKNTDVMPCTRERTDFCIVCVEINSPRRQLDGVAVWEHPIQSLISTQVIVAGWKSRRTIRMRSSTNQTYPTSRTGCFKIVEQCSWAMLPWCKREGSPGAVDVAGEMSLRWRLMPRPDCLVRILEMPNRRSRAKASPTRLPPNDADVDGASAVRPATTVGRGGRAVPRGQARGQAQGQAVAAGTSSRLSLLMLCGRVSCHVRAAGRDCEAYLLLL